jgi:hypothetical protein
VGRVTLAPFAHYIAVKRKSVTQKDASNSRRPPFCVLFDYILSSFVGFQLREEAERHAAPWHLLSYSNTLQPSCFDLKTKQFYSVNSSELGFVLRDCWLRKIDKSVDECRGIFHPGKKPLDQQVPLLSGQGNSKSVVVVVTVCLFQVWMFHFFEKSPEQRLDIGWSI